MEIRIQRPRLKPGFVATLTGLIGNTFLCILKLSIGLWTSSLALLSDGVNSLTDAVSSTAILVAVRVSHKEADEGHPFGHHRAEPIAGLIVAIFAGIAGFEILKASVIRLFTGEESMISGPWPFVVLFTSLVVKTGMSLFFYRVGRKLNSPALLAGALDSQIDVLISIAALIGITGSYLGFQVLDPIMALVITGFIFRSGYKIGKENIDYLMGKSPNPELLAHVRKHVARTQGVSHIDSLRAHYVGNYIHVEVEVSTAAVLSILDLHDLEECVQREVETIPSIDKAFVHVNPKTPHPG